MGAVGMEPTNEEYSTMDVLEGIVDRIVNIKSRLTPILRADPRVQDENKAVEQPKSQQREKLADILTELDSLLSRIEL